MFPLETVRSEKGIPNGSFCFDFQVLTLEKLNALNTVLEAFGNARTCLNVNATRCTNLISLDFDQSGQIASLSLQVS